MEMTEIEALLSNVEKTVVTAKEMIEDYKVVKNDMSKQYLFAAINKLIKPFEIQPAK